MKNFALTFISIFLSTLLFGQKSSMNNDSWGHFGYDNCYTSYNPYETEITTDNVSNLVRSWGVGCDDGYFSVIWRTPAIYSGSLYTSGAGNNLNSYTITSASWNWEYGDGNVGWAAQPVVSDNGILIYLEQAMPTYVYRVDPETGAEIWKCPLSFNLGFSGTAEAVATIDDEDSLVYIIETDIMGGKLYALNSKTGKVAWYKSEAKDSLAFMGSFVLNKDSFIYVPAIQTEGYGNLFHMCRINVLSEKVEITYQLPDSVTYHDPVAYSICNDKLIVGYDEQYEAKDVLAAYYLDSEEVVWELQLGKLTGNIACNTDSNIIYVPTDPYLYAIDASTGEELWKYTGYGEIYTPSIANGIIYFISGSNMWALDEAEHTELFNFDLGYDGEPSSQVAVIGEQLYFSGNGGDCDLFVLGFSETSTENEQCSCSKSGISRVYSREDRSIVVEAKFDKLTDLNVSIYDINGRLIYQSEQLSVEENELVINDFYGLPGCYLCKINITNGDMYTKKFVIR